MYLYDPLGPLSIVVTFFRFVRTTLFLFFEGAILLLEVGGGWSLRIYYCGCTGLMIEETPEMYDAVVRAAPGPCGCWRKTFVPSVVLISRNPTIFVSLILYDISDGDDNPDFILLF